MQSQPAVTSHHNPDPLQHSLVPPTVIEAHHISLRLVSPRVQENIIKGECVDFFTLTTKAMFGHQGSEV